MKRVTLKTSRRGGMRRGMRDIAEDSELKTSRREERGGENERY